METGAPPHPARPAAPAGPYTVRSRFAETGLTCTPAVAEQVQRLAAPYLSLEPGPAGPGTWRMAAGEPPAAGALPEPVQALGEVAVEYAVDRPARTVFHLAPRGDSWAAQSLLRATRAAHRSAASRQGVVFLHSGLVELDGLGVALVGSSRAGKTTFAMASVLGGSGVMVCNDDVGLTTGGGPGVTGTGWPRSVSVRLDTLDLLFGPTRAGEILGSLTHPANETLPSLREAGIERHGTALIYPWEYAGILGTAIGREARVDAVVHLGLADGPSDTVLAPVPPPARAGLLEKHFLGLPNKHLNIFGHEPGPGLAERTRAALADLPAFRFRYEFRDVRREVDRLARHLREHVPRP
jgi:hypothetical protein